MLCRPQLFYLQILTMLTHIGDAWRAAKGTGRYYNCSAMTRFIKLVYLRTMYGYNIRSACYWGYLKPGSRVTSQSPWSGKKIRKYQYALNPPEYIGETDDKLRFAKMCLRERLPAPRICGIFQPGGGFHSLEEDAQSDLNWEQFVEYHLSDEFVVKPQSGYGGHLVYVFRKDENRIHSKVFGSMSFNQFHAKLKELYIHNPALIQEKVSTHPALIEQLKVDILTTVRMILVREKEGSDRIIYSHIKLPGIGREIDNFGYGEAGGVMAELNTETGTIETSTQGIPEGFGIKIITHHPVTGVRLTGVQIPMWKETCALAIKASRAVKNLRSVGWDIAITPNGPSLIEGNSAWGYPNTNESIHHIQTELVKVCGKL
jgi:hypothetical protein